MCHFIVQNNRALLFEENGQTETINAAHYVQMPQILHLPQTEENWFQQYAETSHMARISMEIFLEKAFQTDSFLEIVRFHVQIIFVVLQVQNVCE